MLNPCSLLIFFSKLHVFKCIMGNAVNWAGCLLLFPYPLSTVSLIQKENVFKLVSSLFFPAKENFCFVLLGQRIGKGVLSDKVSFPKGVH